MYEIALTKSYKKSYKRISNHKNFSKSELEKVINLLSRGEPLPKKYLDHELTGILKGMRECHIKNDLLLIYSIHKKLLVITLIEIGTHSSLFG